MYRFVLMVLIIAILACGAPTQGFGSTTSRPTVAMVRTDQPPTIDGVLNDPSWARAAVITDLAQVEPREGAPPSERTEIRLLYDQDFLYLGIRCFYSEPDQIIATELQRDGNFDPDDRISFVLDTFHDRRNAFFFQTNPRGAKGDGLIENSERPILEWDGIWYVETSIDDQGWVAEIAIPYKTLSFDPRGTSWGFNFQRVMRRYDEEIRWTAVSQDKRLFDIAEAGVLTGITRIKQGIGLDVKPSFTIKNFRDRTLKLLEAGPEDEETTIDPSLDVVYRITPSLAATLTLNTDFAETEVDEREINLTRFDLFFPEKRDFFLQDAGIFVFGGLERNARPFFSRRIGLDDEGEVVDIIAGAKLTGRIGPVNLGILDVQTAEKGELETKNLLVSRVAVNVLRESTAGFIFTRGDPLSNDDNWLFGVDFNYHNTEFLEDQVLTGNLWFQKSESTDRNDRQIAYGARLDYPSDLIEAGLGFTEIQQNFRPALGFLNRRGIRQYNSNFRYRFRHRGIFRTIDSGFEAEVVTDDRENDLETAEVKFDLVRLRNNPGDRLDLSYIFQREVLEEDFEIVEGVVIPVDDFNFDRYSIRLTSSDGRPLSGGLEVTWGEFFTGDRTTIKPILAWRPSPHFFFGAEYEYNDVNLPEGDFETNLARVRLNIQFNPDLTWANLIQYDDVSESIGINSRLQWIVLPGNDIFLVLNQGFSKETGSFESTITEAAIKAEWTFRF